MVYTVHTGGTVVKYVPSTTGCCRCPRRKSTARTVPTDAQGAATASRTGTRPARGAPTRSPPPTHAYNAS